MITPVAITDLGEARRRAYKDIYADGSDIILISTDRSLSGRELVAGRGEYTTTMSVYWRAFFNLRFEIPQVPRALEPRACQMRSAIAVPFDLMVFGHRVGLLTKLGLNPTSSELDDGVCLCVSRDCRSLSFGLLTQLYGHLVGDLINKSRNIFWKAKQHAARRGLTLAATKLRWGHTPDGLLPIDELLTTNNSLYWPDFADGLDFDLRSPCVTALASRHKSVWGKLSPPKLSWLT